MDDLVARLTAAIDDLAALAQRIKDIYIVRNPDHERNGEPYWPTPRVEAAFRQYRPSGIQLGLDLIKACSPDVVLRGCAADRKMLAAVQRGIDGHPGQHAFTIPGREEWACTECVEWNKTVLDPSVLTFLAERYDLEVTSG